MSDLEKIKITVDIFKNDYYSVIGSKDLSFDIAYISHNNIPSSPSNNNIPSFPSFIVTVSKKNIKLNPIMFSIPAYPLSSIDYFKYALKEIKNKLDTEAIAKISQLATLHTETFSIRELKKYESFDQGLNRLARSKFIGYRNEIAWKGRFGPAKYALYNSKTLFDIQNNIDMDWIIADRSHDMNYSCNENIEDNVIIFGRKNTLPDPGVYCAILTDENNNILFNEQMTLGLNRQNVIMYCAIFDAGSSPEDQYLRVETKDLIDKRREKLLKIKALYG